MAVERLYQYLQALPSREAERALLAFRSSSESWDVCLGIVSGAHGPIRDPLALFAAQTLHACARRVPLPKDGTPTTLDDPAALSLISKQRSLLSALTDPGDQGGKETALLCAALAALSVRNVGTLRDLLHAALQQLPQWLAVQLLLSMAEECEALQARAGSEVGSCAAAQHVLREEVGHLVLTWLAGVAATHINNHYNNDNDQPSQQRGRLLSLTVRCVGAWSRLGCLYSACCPVEAVRGLLAAALGCAHPGSGTSASLRHEACEALSDVIEHGPDALLRELNSPLVQLATAVTSSTHPHTVHAATSSSAEADAVYDIAQLVSSYAAARLGELVAAACGSGGDGADGGAATSASADAASALVGALCHLASLSGWTAGGYPVGWPALQALADLALGCIAAVPPQPPPSSSSYSASIATSADVGGDAVADAMQQDGGAEPSTAAMDAAADEPSPTNPGREEEHSVPDITLGPRPGLPPPLLLMYDNVLRSVLSCCVSWSLMDAGDSGGGGNGGAGSGGGGGGGGEGDEEAVGLLRLPPECGEALRGCLQACGGVVGQARQLENAAALLQHTAAATAVAAAEAGAATSAAALTAALAAVSACGVLPLPSVAGAAGEAAAAAASRLLLAAAAHLRGSRRGAAFDVPLLLQYCQALPGSCGAVLQVQAQVMRRPGAPQPAAPAGLPPPAVRADQPAGSDSAGVSGALALCHLAGPALEAGLRLEATAVAAARALRALVAAARDLGLPLPASLAAALVDSVHELRYDGGPTNLATERELVRAAVIAAAAGAEGLERTEVWQRLLAPAVARITQVAAAAAAVPGASPPPQPPLAAPQGCSPPPPPPATTPTSTAANASRILVSRHQDAVLARQLRLLDAALASSAASPSADATAAVFLLQAWPPLRALLQRGGAGRFLMPMCRCATALLRRAAATAGGSVANSGGGEAMEGPASGGADADADPWVGSVLETLAGCVGRPGAKHVYEPLISLLEICTTPTEPPMLKSSGAGTAGAAELPARHQQQRWRQRHAVLAACTVYSILHGQVATEMAAAWCAADRDPDTAECLLRLAAAAVRYGGPAEAAPDGAMHGGGCVGGPSGVEPPAASASAVQGFTTRAAVAAAALRLAAASSGCDHRQVSVAALLCTCAVLEAACGSPWPSGGGGPSHGGDEADGAAAALAASESRQLLMAVVQSGPLITAGLLAALLSASPLPRLQRVATALVLMAAAVAACCELEQLQRQAPATGDPGAAAAVEWCTRLLGSWLVSAATYLQLPPQEGAALAGSWAPLLAEAGLGAAAVAACSSSSALHPQRPPTSSGSLSLGALQGGASCAARGLSRKLRRLLREFAESRLRG